MFVCDFNRHFLTSVRLSDNTTPDFIVGYKYEFLMQLFMKMYVKQMIQDASKKNLPEAIQISGIFT